MVTLEKKLQSLVNTLILNLEYTRTGDIYSGKLGSLPLLYHYSEMSSEDSYAEVADLYLTSILKDVNDKMYHGLAGLGGIGWTLCYLKKNKFVSFQNDVLTDVQRHINIKVDKQDYCNRTGLAGKVFFLTELCEILAKGKNAGADLFPLVQKLVVATDAVGRYNDNFAHSFPTHSGKGFWSIVEKYKFEKYSADYDELADMLFAASRLSCLPFYTVVARGEASRLANNSREVVEKLLSFRISSSMDSFHFSYHRILHRLISGIMLIDRLCGKVERDFNMLVTEYISEFWTMSIELPPTYEKIAAVLTIFQAQDSLRLPETMIAIKNDFFVRWMQSFFHTDGNLAVPVANNRTATNIPLGVNGLGGLGLACMAYLDSAQLAGWKEPSLFIK